VQLVALADGLDIQVLGKGLAWLGVFNQPIDGNGRARERSLCSTSANDSDMGIPSLLLPLRRLNAQPRV
jgi:hypothetical protein